MKEMLFNGQGQSPRGPDIGLSELLEGTMSSCYIFCALYYHLSIHGAVRGETAPHKLDDSVTNQISYAILDYKLCDGT